MEPVIEEKKKELVTICQKHHVRRLDLFGSAAQGDFSTSSDIDFIVEFDENVAANRFDNYFDLLNALRVLFERDIDLVEPGGVRNPYFLQSVEQTRRPVYVA